MGRSGLHRAKRPSGAQQRKESKKRKEIMREQIGATLQYVKKTPEDEQPGSSKDTALPLIATSSESEASIHSEEEVENMEKLEGAEDIAESDSSYDTDTEHQMSDVQGKDLQILHDVSFWEIPVPDTVEMQTRKWKDLLCRLLDITLFLAKQNVAFLSHKEDETSLNKGNFLEMVKVLSKYDPVLKEHLMKLNKIASKHRVSVSYLSPSIQNEFISALAKHVRQKLVMEIQSSQCFGIMFDSTPDVSHTDQMAEVIRYVKIYNRTVEIKEVFLQFFPLEGKTADEISSDILNCLEKDGLSIMMCRAQCYDNAANMAGIHEGVQAVLKSKNRKAIFSGCVDHSLNLCGHHSFSENASCGTFFGTLESIFTFFTASTHRWNVLIAHTGIAVERLSATRWSAHHAAVKPLKENFDTLVAAIQALCEPEKNTVDTRNSANYLLKAVLDFSFLCYLYLWGALLEEVNITQQCLQTKGLSLDRVVMKMEALKMYLLEGRSRVVECAIEQALLKSEECGIDVERRVRLKKMMPGEQAKDSQLALQEENRRSMVECMDRFHSELDTRLKAIKEVADMFEAVQPQSLMCATEDDLKVSLPKLTHFYDELSESALLVEIPRLRMHMKALKINMEDAKKWEILDILKFIVEWDFMQSLPILSLSLQLFLTVCVSVASCNRSISKKKLIKNYLRSTMGQSRLSNLAILSIESELASEMDFDEVIKEFANAKARKGEFL